ncbi:MAG: hypothetical protein HZB61_06875 [Nitrospirae bacterium]|nr:hypothetical protein [Nitrospirota bacterium]
MREELHLKAGVRNIHIVKAIIFICVLCVLFIQNVWSEPTKWIEVGPGGGGAVQDLAFDLNDINRVYLTSDMVGVFVSDDAGDHWKWSSYGASGRKGGIAVDPTNSDILYSVGIDGIYQSTDRAKHWQLVYSKGNGFRGVNNRDFKALGNSIFGEPGQPAAISKTGIIYVCTLAGDIITSFDKGKTWKEISVDGKNEVKIVVPIDDKKVIAVFYEDGIYLSNNRGLTWQKVMSSAQGKFIASAINPVSRNILYTLVAELSTVEYEPRYSVRSFPAYLYRSEDGGTTWALIHSFEKLAIGKGRRLMDVSPAGTLIILSLEGPLRSSDGGQTWSISKINSQDDDGFIYNALKGHMDGTTSVYADYRKTDRWYMTDMLAAFRSDDDGKSWYYKVKGLRQDGYLFVKVNPENPDRVLASDGDHGLIISDDSGNTWRNNIINNPYEECSQLRFSPNDTTYRVVYTYCVTPTGSSFMAKSTDAGESWMVLKRWGSEKSHLITKFCLTKGEKFPNIYIGEEGAGIWKSSDDGKSWELKKIGSLRANDMTYFQFLESDSSGSLYAGIASMANGMGGIFKSIDSGETWFSINKGLEDLFVRRGSFEIDPNNPDILWVGAGRSVYRSISGGKNWEKRIEGVFSGAILVEPGNSDVVYVSSFTGGGVVEQYTEGIYKSVDGGNFFFNISGELFRTIGSSYRVYDLEYGWKGTGRIWAAPSAGGLIYTVQ